MSDVFDDEAQRRRREEADPPHDDGPSDISGAREADAGEPPAVEEPRQESPWSRPVEDEPRSDTAWPPPTEEPPWARPADEPRRDDEPWRDEPFEWPQRPETAAAPPPAAEHEGGLNPLVRLGIPQPWRTIIDWIVTIAGAVAIVLAVKAWIINPYRIPSSSMEPTLHCGTGSSGCTSHFSDRVLANRFIYRFRAPHRGEIVVFNVPDKAKSACGAGGVFVKRIVGLPGETWQERNGVVYINGRRLREPYIKNDRRDFQTWPTRKIPKDGYFMMGDNRQSSCDSRRWGTVPRANIIGKVFALYWPPQRIRLM